MTATVLDKPLVHFGPEIGLEGTRPVWTFAVGDALIQRRIWIAHGANTTYVSYRLLRGSQALELEVTPLLTYRNFHVLSRGSDWYPAIG